MDFCLDKCTKTTFRRGRLVRTTDTKFGYYNPRARNGRIIQNTLVWTKEMKFNIQKNQKRVLPKSQASLKERA